MIVAAIVVVLVVPLLGRHSNHLDKDLKIV
jgi:hypothetical protein